MILVRYLFRLHPQADRTLSPFVTANLPPLPISVKHNSNSHFGLLEPEIERVWELSGGGRLNIF